MKQSKTTNNHQQIKTPYNKEWKNQQRNNQRMTQKLKTIKKNKIKKFKNPKS